MKNQWASAPAVKKGSLKKKSGFWGSWKDHWFVLEGTLLLEFKNESVRFTYLCGVEIEDCVLLRDLLLLGK
jgi:hypothetical protein